MILNMYNNHFLILLIMNYLQNTYAYVITTLHRDCINSSAFCCNYDHIIPLPISRKCLHCTCVGTFNNIYLKKKNTFWNKREDYHYQEQFVQTIAYDLLNKSKLFNEYKNYSVAKGPVLLRKEKEGAPLHIIDALGLLGPNVNDDQIRKYAVSSLEYTSDDDLASYLLQLVQALKYEYIDDVINACQSSTNDPETCDIHVLQQTLLRKSIFQVSNQTNNIQKFFVKKVNDLSSFLIRRASANSILASFLYWYLLMECKNPAHKDGYYQSVYLLVMQTFLQVLTYHNFTIRNELLRQQLIFDALHNLLIEILENDETKFVKIEMLRHAIKNENRDVFGINFTNFQPIPFPLEPHVYIKGIVAKKATFFTSVLMPCKLHFLTTENTEFIAIFKHGTDLRQDQLILQIITLMDNLFKNNDLDLKLIPYKIIALSTEHGLVQYVKSVTLSKVLDDGGTIQDFFRKHAPDNNGTFGINKEVYDNFIRSCAGYSVITYVLGIGDRHFDNLLLTTNGNLFHVDFGYILGNNPTIINYPIVMSTEIIEAMGGIESKYYEQFKRLCSEAYLLLRRNASLFSSILSLMSDSGVKDIAEYTDNAIHVVNDYMRLDLNDEDAVKHLERILNTSAHAILPEVYEQMHKVAQFFREL